MRKEGGVSSLPKAVRKGLRKAMSEEKPFLLAPVNWLASKVVGKGKVDDLYWKGIQKPILDVDVALGQKAQKLTDKLTGKSGKLFKEQKLLETGKRVGSQTGKREFDIPSVLAPASKAGKIVIPTLGAIKLEEMVRGKNMSDKKITKSDLQKTAAMLSHLNEKRAELEKKAKATELLYKQAEMGQIKFPETYADYREKVAELLSKDLNVVEEAIKMASSTEETNSFDGLEVKQANVTNARDRFAMSIVED